MIEYIEVIIALGGNAAVLGGLWYKIGKCEGIIKGNCQRITRLESIANNKPKRRKKDG